MHVASVHLIADHYAILLGHNHEAVQCMLKALSTSAMQSCPAWVLVLTIQGIMQVHCIATCAAVAVPQTRSRHCKGSMLSPCCWSCFSSSQPESGMWAVAAV